MASKRDATSIFNKLNMYTQLNQGYILLNVKYRCGEESIIETSAMAYIFNQNQGFVNNLISTMKDSVGLEVNDILISGNMTVVDEEDFLVAVLSWFSVHPSTSCMDIWLNNCQNK